MKNAERTVMGNDWSMSRAHHDLESVRAKWYSDDDTRKVVGNFVEEQKKPKVDIGKIQKNEKALLEVNRNIHATSNECLTEHERLKKELSALKHENMELWKQVDVKQQENQELTKHKSILSIEKENALSRLSKIAGIQLTKGNSDITDLSDANKLTKLAEKWSSLYTDVWSEAYDELTMKWTIKKNENCRGEKELFESADVSDDIRPTSLAEKFESLYNAEWTGASDTVMEDKNFEIYKELCLIDQECFKLCQEIGRKHMEDIITHVWDTACYMYFNRPPDQLLSATETPRELELCNKLGSEIKIMTLKEQCIKMYWSMLVFDEIKDTEFGYFFLERLRIVIKVIKEIKEIKENIRQRFLMLLFIILIRNISENVKCRQRSNRKYPCLNSILYLLWQSGDVEVNPGPANSTTYRNWLFDTCSVVRKAIAGVSAHCKMDKIWKKQPDNWPSGKLYFDPRNSKGLSVNKVEDFLQTLIHCYDGTSKLSHDIISEIDTWNSHRSKDNDQLLYLYRTRECLKLTEQVDRSLKVLQSHLLPDEILTVEVNPCIRISLSGQPALNQQLIIHTIYRAEATRKIASVLRRILHGKDPEKKCDHIWTIKPDGWPSNLRYYNPNNGGERRAQNEDGMIVESLITLCEQKPILLQKLYQDMVDAWQAHDQTLLSKLLTRHTAETDLKKAVIKLHEEGLLQNPEVDKHLRELGLHVQYDGSNQNSKSLKRKMVNTMHEHETKRTKQSDLEDAVNTTTKELFFDCSIVQLLDKKCDSSLLDIISQNVPDFLGDEADDIQFLWT